MKLKNIENENSYLQELKNMGIKVNKFDDSTAKEKIKESLIIAYNIDINNKEKLVDDLNKLKLNLELLDVFL